MRMVLFEISRGKHLLWSFPQKRIPPVRTQIMYLILLPYLETARAKTKSRTKSSLQVFTVSGRSKNISGWLYKIDTILGISGHWGDIEKMYTPVQVS